MMEQLREAVTGLAAQEYARAAEAHGGAASSPHEGYALIREELEEAREELDRADQFLDHLWHGVRADELQFMPHCLREIKTEAILGACELIQTAAMAEKALAGLGLPGSVSKSDTSGGVKDGR